jgi:hypothetical protein
MPVKSLRITSSRTLGADIEGLSPELTEWDQQAYERIISYELSPEQQARVTTPDAVYPKQAEVLAVHWHPEFIPMKLIAQRVDAMFPNRTDELIIPTQHNELLEWNGYAGVEVDCFSEGFNRKVQLLVHFAAERVAQADVFRAMLAHTFKYRSSQLHEFLDTIIDPAREDRLQQAAAKTGASDELVQFVRVHATKLKELIDRNEQRTPADMLKNKLLRYYFDNLREHFDDRVISHAQIFLNAVKKVVKQNFSLRYFYRTEEVIEEIRALGGCIIIPHPEQFWPILLADYDVDGIEVWNPQSQEYTRFLVACVDQQNKTQRDGKRPLLVTMGDDTHFGEKVLKPQHQDPDKARRELGFQPAWDDLAIRKSLIVADASRASVIAHYKARLG